MGVISRLVLVIFLILSASVLVHASNIPQPQSFSKPSPENEVDLYTGDVNFPVTLLTVPGRSLNYPVSIVYHSGILSGQSSSAVGLGWSLSVGTISRTVVNLPDDYCASCISDMADNNYGIFHKQPFSTSNVGKQSFGANLIQSLAFSMVSFVFFPPSGPAAGSYLLRSLGAASASAAMGSLAYGNSHFNDLYDNNAPNVYHNLRLNGFSWQTQSGSSALSGYDLQTPDIYTLSGDYASGRLILIEPKPSDSALTFHLQKPAGHTAKITDQTQCTNQAGHYSQCPDTLMVNAQRDASALGKGRFSQFDVIAADGTKYAYVPTEWTTGPNGNDPSPTQFAQRDESNDDNSCDSDSNLYLKKDLRWQFATTFGISKIVSYDGDGTDAKGDYVQFTYISDANDILHHRTPYSTSTCVTGPLGRKTWSEYYQKVSYVSRIETSTHYATFEYVSDRRDGLEYAGTRRPRRLNSVTLYYKDYSDGSGNYVPRMVQKVRLSQSYDLMKGVPDSDPNFGKLTLTGLDLYQGGNAPNGEFWGSYSFQYANGDASGTGDNPVWSLHQRDRWGYYCANCVQGDYNLDGASPSVSGLKPQAWSLTKITYPMGGYTQYQFESDRYTKLNSWYANAVPSLGMEKEDTHYGGGARVALKRVCDGLGGCQSTRYLYTNSANLFSESDGYSISGTPGDSSGVATNEPAPYTFDHAKDDRLFMGSTETAAYVGYGKVFEYPGYDEANVRAPFGYVSHTFTTAADYPNTGAVTAATTYTDHTGALFGVSTLSQIHDGVNDGYNDFAGYNCPLLIVAPKGTKFGMYFIAGGYPRYQIIKTVGDDPSEECGSSTTGCVDIDMEGYDQPVETVKVIVDPNPVVTKPADFYLGMPGYDAPSAANIDRCCPDVDHNYYCDVMDIPAEKRFSGSVDNDFMRGLEISTDYFQPSKGIVKSIAYTYSEYPEPNPASYMDLVSRWVKLDSISTTENGLTKTVAYAYDEKSALAGVPAVSTQTGTAGEKKIDKFTFAFELYPDFLSTQSNNFHHLYTPLFESRTYKDNVNTLGNLWKLSRTTYCKFSAVDGTCAGAGALFYQPWQTLAWQKKDASDTFAENNVIKTRENIRYDAYGHVDTAQDASGARSREIYSDSTSPCGADGVVGDRLRNAVVTCSQDALGHSTVYAFDPRRLLTLVTDPNGRSTTFQYDAFDRLNYIIPPVDAGTPYWTKKYTYYLAPPNGGISSSNENAFSTYSKIDASRNINSVTVDYFDGMGRNDRTYQYDANTGVESNTRYNGIGWPSAAYLPHQNGIPLSQAKSSQVSYAPNPLGQVNTSVEPGSTLSWNFIQNYQKTVSAFHGSQGLVVSDVPKSGFYKISCTTNGNPVFYLLAIYDGSTQTEPVILKCLTLPDSAHVFLEKGRTYYLYASESRFLTFDGTVTLSINGLYAPQGGTLALERSTQDREFTQKISADADGHVQIDKLDKFGRLVEHRLVQDPVDQVISYSYDVLGRRKTVTDALGQITQYSYDRMGNLETVQSSDLGLITSNYDALGRLLSRNQNGNTVTHTYDAGGRVVSTVYDLNPASSIYYSYDQEASGNENLNGRLHFVNTPTIIRQLAFSARGKMTLEKILFQGTCSNADGSVRFTYGCPDVNGDGSVTVADSISVSALLAKLDQPGIAAVPYADPLYSPFLDFDRNGEVTDAEAAVFSSALSSGLSGLRPVLYTTRFDYDDAGNVKSTVYPLGLAWQASYQSVTWNVEHNPLNQLSGVALPAASQRADYLYDTEGLLRTVTYPGGVLDAYTYGADNRLTAQSSKKGASVLFSEAYDYTPGGNLFHLYANDVPGTNLAATFTYDAAQRLVLADSETVAYRGTSLDYFGMDQSYTYDNNGNRLTANGQAYQYDAVKKNRLLFGNGCSLAYDANGNVQSKTCNGQTTTFQFDGHNQLSRIVYPDASCDRFEYDETGNRVKKTYTLKVSGILSTFADYYVYGNGKLLQDLTWVPQPVLAC